MVLRSNAAVNKNCSLEKCMGSTDTGIYAAQFAYDVNCVSLGPERKVAQYNKKETSDADKVAGSLCRQLVARAARLLCHASECSERSLLAPTEMVSLAATVALCHDKNFGRQRCDRGGARSASRRHDHRRRRGEDVS
eukprot:1117896-Rhodomonas_salina.3